MITKNNIIPHEGGGGYGIDEKVVLHTYRLTKQFIVSRKKVLHYE